MTRAAAARRPAEAVPAFSRSGHHPLPAIDDDRRLLGRLIQADRVRARLFPAVVGVPISPVGAPQLTTLAPRLPFQPFQPISAGGRHGCSPILR